MTTRKFIRIVNWGTFQHYKDRNPPWIKLHRDMITSRTWVTADDASRVLVIACMVLAAETNNKIPFDAEFIRRRAYLSCDPDFTQLIDAQFIELIDESGNASNALAECVQLARPETETETEKRHKNTPAPRGACERIYEAYPRHVGKAAALKSNRQGDLGHSEAKGEHC